MLDSSIVNYFPKQKDLLLWVTAVSETGQTYYVVSDKNREEYFLYKGDKKTTHKSSDPTSLYRYIV